MDGPIHKSLDVVLSSIDPPLMNEKFLMDITKEEFKAEFSPNNIIDATYHKGLISKLIAVIPCNIRNGKVVPLPCILDTGAPKYGVPKSNGI